MLQETDTSTHSLVACCAVSDVMIQCVFKIFVL